MTALSKPMHLLTQSKFLFGVEPIRDKKAIQRIKKLLRDRPRDLCLFTLVINTAFWANELLAIKIGAVRHHSDLGKQMVLRARL